MVGYATDDGRLLITDVSGPGEGGKCLPFAVTVDGQHAKEFCDQAFARSFGAIDFVGDWHCHPAISVRPSEGDRLAIKVLAETPGLPLNPVSLIYSSWTGIYKIYSWDSANQRLRKVKRRAFGNS